MKKIAVMMYRMGCGGVERALIELLKRIDPNEYAVDLFLLEQKGEFLELIPEYINQMMLDIPDLDRELVQTMEIRPTVKSGIASGHFLQTVDLLLRYIKHKLRKTPAPAYVTAFEKMEMVEYDIALDFHGYASATTYVLAEKVNAKKKYTWIHGESCLRDLPVFWTYLQKFDKIFCVSGDLAESVKAILPQCSRERIEVFHNFVDCQRILERAADGPRLSGASGASVKLLTVGRMAWEKGYDMAIEAAAILKNRGIDFHWFFGGDGPLRSQLEQQIAQHGLVEQISLLGYCENPYSLMKDCDIYVQPSRSEGYGITIVEALVLGCPVISTRVAGAKEEITGGVNGMVEDIDARSIADGVTDLLSQPQLLNEMKRRNADFGTYNAESMKMFWEIL